MNFATAVQYSLDSCTLSCNFVNVYTIAYCVHVVHARIPRPIAACVDRGTHSAAIGGERFESVIKSDVTALEHALLIARVKLTSCPLCSSKLSVCGLTL